MAKPISLLKIDRKEYLRLYMLLCLRDGALTFADIANPFSAADRVFTIIKQDVSVVAAQIIREKGGGLLKTIGSSMARLASDAGFPIK